MKFGNMRFDIDGYKDHCIAKFKAMTDEACLKKYGYSQEDCIKAFEESNHEIMFKINRVILFG